VRLNPLTGNAIIVLETGDLALASAVTSEWTLLKSGNLDLVMFKNSVKGMVNIILVGYLLILLIALVTGWRMKKTAKISSGKA
jgi:hypothetical protein